MAGQLARGSGSNTGGAARLAGQQAGSTRRGGGGSGSGSGSGSGGGSRGTHPRATWRRWPGPAPPPGSPRAPGAHGAASGVGGVGHEAERGPCLAPPRLLRPRHAALRCRVRCRVPRGASLPLQPRPASPGAPAPRSAAPRSAPAAAAAPTRRPRAPAPAGRPAAPAPCCREAREAAAAAVISRQASRAAFPVCGGSPCPPPPGPPHPLLAAPPLARGGWGSPGCSLGQLRPSPSGSPRNTKAPAPPQQRGRSPRHL